ncbi:MAG: hypothetical protein ACT4PL_03010 [Phycisphaerales bacterium]
MNRHRTIVSLALLGLAMLGGCTRGYSTANRVPVDGDLALSVMPEKTGRMPLAVGDAVGCSVFTTRKSLVARGHLDEKFLYATGEATSD